MLTVDDAALAARLRRLRERGLSVSAAERHATDRPVHEQYLETGFNYRMTDIQAAMGLVQLSRLDAMVTRRRVWRLATGCSCPTCLDCTWSETLLMGRPTSSPVQSSCPTTSR